MESYRCLGWQTMRVQKSVKNDNNSEENCRNFGGIPSFLMKVTFFTDLDCSNSAGKQCRTAIGNEMVLRFAGKTKFWLVFEQAG